VYNLQIYTRTDSLHRDPDRHLYKIHTETRRGRPPHASTDTPSPLYPFSILRPSRNTLYAVETFSASSRDLRQGPTRNTYQSPATCGLRDTARGNLLRIRRGDYLDCGETVILDLGGRDPRPNLCPLGQSLPSVPLFRW
jgi:hypothetical protein